MRSVYRDAVIRMARGGATIAQISESLGCSRQTIYSNWPPDIPTPHMRNSAQKWAEDFETIVMLKDKGWTQAKIAKKLGINISRVHRVISRYNASLANTDNDRGAPGGSPKPPPSRQDDIDPGHLLQ